MRTPQNFFQALFAFPFIIFPSMASPRSAMSVGMKAGARGLRRGSLGAAAPASSGPGGVGFPTAEEAIAYFYQRLPRRRICEVRR